MEEKEQGLTQEQLMPLRQWAVSEISSRYRNHVGYINLIQQANELVDYLLHGTIPPTPTRT